MAEEKEFRVLVTGGLGFLGREVVKTLKDRHPRWKIDVLDVTSPDGRQQRFFDDYISADIRSEHSVNAALENYTPDLVIHTAGIVPGRQFRYSTSASDWERVKAVNYDGTRNVLNAALASGCKRFLYTSSVTVIIDDLAHEYPHMNEATAPTGVATLHYGRSKALAEAFVLSSSHVETHELQACILRPCPIIGPEDTQVVSLIHDLIGKGETHFIVGDGHNLYDWMYIDNAAYAHALAAENLLIGPRTAAGEVFHISNQEPAYFWDLLAYIWAQFGHAPRFRLYIPVTFAFAVAFVLEFVTWLLGTPATLDRGSVRDAVRTCYADNSKAVRVLGYRPLVGLSEGVRRSCEGYKRQLAARELSNGGLKNLMDDKGEDSRADVW